MYVVSLVYQMLLTDQDIIGFDPRGSEWSAEICFPLKLQY